MQTITFECRDHIVMSPEDFEALEAELARVNATFADAVVAWGQLLHEERKRREDAERILHMIDEECAFDIAAHFARYDACTP